MERRKGVKAQPQTEQTRKKVVVLMMATVAVAEGRAGLRLRGHATRR